MQPHLRPMERALHRRQGAQPNHIAMYSHVPGHLHTLAGRASLGGGRVVALATIEGHHLRRRRAAQDLDAHIGPHGVAADPVPRAIGHPLINIFDSPVFTACMKLDGLHGLKC